MTLETRVDNLEDFSHEKYLELRNENQKLQLQIIALRAGLVSAREQIKKFADANVKLCEAFEKLVKALSTPREVQQ